MPRVGSLLRVQEPESFDGGSSLRRASSLAIRSSDELMSSSFSIIRCSMSPISLFMALCRSLSILSVYFRSRARCRLNSRSTEGGRRSPKYDSQVSCPSGNSSILLSMEPADAWQKTARVAVGGRIPDCMNDPDSPARAKCILRCTTPTTTIKSRGHANASARLLEDYGETRLTLMYISRIVIRNFRNFEFLDLALGPGVFCIVGENNTGKTNLLHAIRLAIDISLSSQYRQLIEHDIHSGADLTVPNHVLVSLELSDYSGQEKECALVGAWEVSPDLARITYRFRPTRAVREEIEAEERAPSGLTLEDYNWELTGGGGIDPKDASWNEDFGHSVRFSDLQSFQVVFLQALRDVQQDLHQIRTSPLGKLLTTSDIPEAEKTALVEILRAANKSITGKPTISSTGKAIQKSFSSTVGDAFDISLRLGMADPSFSSIARSLTILLSNSAMSDFQPDRNGLGINNILYISMLLEYFERRVASPNTAGQLLLEGQKSVVG